MRALLLTAVFYCVAASAAAEPQHTCLHGTRGNEVGDREVAATTYAYAYTGTL